MGFPIRKFPDQSLFAAPRDLSQRTTSFIASQRQGIHRTPLWHLIALIANARRSFRLRRPCGRSASASLKLPSANKAVPIRLGSLRVQPLKTEARLALDFSKRPVLLQTHPGTSAVKLGSRLNSSGSRANERSDKPRGLTSSRPGRSTECVSSSQCQIVLASPDALKAPGPAKPVCHRRPFKSPAA